MTCAPNTVEETKTEVRRYLRWWRFGTGGRHGHVVGLLKLKSRVPQGLTHFSAQVRRYSRVRTNPSDNYIDSPQILKTPTYLNVQKKNGTIHFLFSRYKLECWRCVDLPILQSDRGWLAEINKIPVVPSFNIDHCS